MPPPDINGRTSPQSASADLAPEPAPKPKVLFLIRSLELGGAERTFAAFVNNLTRFDPAVLLHDNIVAEPNRIRPDIPCTRILPGSPPVKRNNTTAFLLRQRFREARWIRKLAENDGYRILSSFLLKSNRVAVFTKLFFAPHLRIVVNVHEQMSQHLQHAHSSMLERLVHRFISRLIFRRADLIVAVAQGVKDDLIENFGAPADRIKIVPNPIDLGRIRRLSMESLEQTDYSASDVKLVVAVGRLVKLKGYDLLIQAFASPARQLGAKLVIIGEGEERGALQMLADDLGLGESVFLIGETDNPWKYMARADLFVLSSLTEAFPNVLGEALALGTPILASDCSPGVREYLLDGECGLLCPPGDVKALTDGIERLLTDDALCEALTDKSRQRVEQFNSPSVIEQYEDALASVLEADRSAASSRSDGDA